MFSKSKESFSGRQTTNLSKRNNFKKCFYLIDSESDKKDEKFLGHQAMKPSPRSMVIVEKALIL